MDKITDANKFIKQNERLLNLLRFYRGIDRAELSRKLQLSMPTIYKSIDDLNCINVVDKTESSVLLNNKFGILVGISIGTSLCKIVLLGFDFQLLESESFLQYKEIICKKICENLNNDELLKQCVNDKSKNYIYLKTPNTFSSLKNVINNVFECLQLWVENENLNIISIGISCTGIINKKTQTILDAYNLNYLSNRTLDSLIYPDKQAFFTNNDIYVSLVQNSNAAVVAEKIYLNQINSPYKNKENIVALYFGVGTGAGIYLNQLHEGTSGHAGEVGHTKAPICETSENISRYKELIDSGKIDECCACGCNDCYDYKIRSYVFEKTAKEFCDMSADEIRDYLKKEPSKSKLLGEYWGNMINIITSWLDVDLVIFTGKIYKSMGLLLNHIDTIRDESPLKFNRNDCTILVSDYGSLAPSIGAAIYAYHKKYNLELSWNY